MLQGFFIDFILEKHVLTISSREFFQDIFLIVFKSTQNFFLFFVVVFNLQSNL